MEWVKYIGALVGIVTLMGAVISVPMFLDTRYARADDMKKVEQESVKTMRDYRMQQLIRSLDFYDMKEAEDGLRPYETVHKRHIERELEIELREENHDE
jgi:hypothetical protein